MAKKRRERIYLVPRGVGLVFAFTLLLIFAVGFALPHARGLTQTLGIALLVAGVVAMIQSNDNVRGVEITGSRATPTAAGEMATLELTVQNHSDRERIGLQIRKGWRWQSDRWRTKTMISAWIPILEVHEVQTVQLDVPTTRRGRYPIPALWVSSAMPVGLCFAWKTFENHGSYFVYPKPHGIALEREGRSGNGTNDGSEGGSEDVSGHRPYEAGDPLSRMDWRVFARTGKVVVRTLEEGSGGEIYLRWEDTNFLENDEARLEQLSYWIAQCVREGRPFRLLLGTQNGDLSHRNVTACHEALAVYDPGGASRG